MRNNITKHIKPLSLFLLMMLLGGTTVWGQTVKSGVYYIANDNTSNGHPGKVYSSASDTEKYYLVPAADPQQPNAIDAYYSPNHNTTNGDPEKPFLATALTNKDLNSIWIVKESGETGYYFIIHALTGKYAIYEVPLPNDPNKNTDTDETKNGKRKTMHLQTIDNGDYNPSTNDNFKFEITTSGTGYNIRPKRRTGWYWNPAGQNNDVYYGQSSGEKPNLYRNGLVGVYNNTGTNSIWHFEDASSATTLTPVISDVNGADNTFTITSPAAAFSTIYYTTDGSTTPNATTGTTVISGSPITITENWSVQAVGVFVGVFNSFCTPVAGPKDLAPLGCATPVITYDYTTSNVSISCSTPSSTIYYTTDGSTPTTSSTQYSAPFSVGSPTTVKAIATHAALPSSAVAELAITQVATPIIQNNGSNAISITTNTPDAIIYYTTDGTDPTTASTEYTGPLTDNVSNVTIKAIAVKENMITSAVGSGLVKLQCATPVIAKVGMTFTLSCSLPTDATLYYTINGGSETLYSGPVPFTADQLPMTVAAVARHSNYTESETASMEIKKGEGTPDDPYIIYDTTDFTSFITNVNNGTAASACYKLGSDISANGTAAITASYGGIFDGNGYTISDLSHPLFNIVDGGVVKNVMLKNVSISSNGDYVGAIAGIAQGYSRIYNCGILPNDATFPEGEHPTVSTSGSCAGGIVGKLDGDSRVINCFSYADVSATTYAAGIVGYNNFASTAEVSGGQYTKLKTAVVNCMFYGNITGGSNQYGVYGGKLITNAAATGISSYNYYRSGSTFTTTSGNPSAYNCSFPAEERYLIQVEFHRSLLNSNRELCGWWVGSDVAPSTLTTAQVQAIPKDASLMYKWVVDPNVAPYPILKPFGKYASVINGNTGTPWVDRATANPYEGKQLGTLTVIVKSGSHSSVPDRTLSIPITDMDTLHYDFGYRKIQLPYYNTVFGNPEADSWDDKYANNYTDQVVTGWKITAVTTDGTVETYNSFVPDWQNGYNFADRKCIDKDLYDESGRVFAQGGNYYVPDGVTAITIEAYWGKAIYVRNDGGYYDRVNITLANTGSPFAPAGTRDNNVNGATIQTTTKLSSALTNANIDKKNTVYDYALVLVGNIQESVGKNNFKHATEDTRGFTIMSVDLDFDEEPDYCLEWQLGEKMGRQEIAPIRFDFLPVVELGIAGKRHNSTNFYSLGCYRSKGHFEVTETSFIRFGQFEFELGTRDEGPVILNGGIYDQYCRGRNGETNQHINYVILGGHVVMPSFTPGAHVNKDHKYKTRHCAVNALGGDFTSFYLTGGYNEAIEPYEDNPHCYIDGGRFGTIAAAYKEGIWGDVTWRINHALIGEFYGGGVMSQATGTNYKIVKGSIDVVIDNSIVGKYCGGPKFGDMVAGKTVTTSATGTIFNQYFGAGNGGTNYVQYKSTDATGSPVTNWSSTINSNYHPGQYRNTAQGYEADYDIEIINTSTGDQAGKVVNRSYYYSAQFATTNTGNVTSTLNNCTVKTNFYGGGFLGGVSGNVTSTLNNCTVLGSVFGAGYSADAGTVIIHNKDKVAPVVNTYTGLIKPLSDGTSETYYWTNDDGSTSSPSTTVDDKKYFYTEVSLDNLGTVTGDVTLTINGTTTVGKSVYGGGEESGVGGNTIVSVTGGTIGTTNMGGAEFGNVYGGGKGKKGDTYSGLVRGNANVTISGSPVILHNIYGGGAYGSVGTFTYDNTTKMPTALATENTGACTVTIEGGTLGSNGDENGMVFGSSRGDVAAPGNDGVDPNDRTAWVYSTHVTIGDTDAETTPEIKGSVYGSGENGHTFQNTVVDIKKGTVGIASGSNITIGETVYSGAQYPYRGNVYGGGCGTDTYWVDTNENGDKDDGEVLHNPLAGIVWGNATVNMTGGLVVHNIYGAGAMGSVGTMTKDNTGAITINSGGTTTIAISGGTVGVSGNGNGNVFGAARGDSISTQTDVALVKTTYVTISDSATVKGNIYGGGEAGDVGTYTTNVDGSNTYIGGSGVCNVTITGGTIGAEGNGFGNVFGAGKGASNTFECRKAMVNTTIVNISDGTVYGSVFGGGEIARVEGNTAVTLGVEGASGGGYAPDIKGDVYGAGAGVSTHGYSALVRGNPVVSVQGLTKVGGSVYGGGDIASVGKHSLVTLANKEEHPNLEVGMPFTLANTNLGICTVTVKDNAEITGSVFGAGRGINPGELTNPGRMKPDNSMEYYNNNGEPGSYGEGYENALLIYVQTLALATDTHLTVNGNAKVKGSVYGGSESGFVQFNSYVNIQGSCQIGTTDAGGNIFGGGLGLKDNAAAGRVSGNTSLNISGGTMYGSVYGGGAYGYVGTYTVSADGRDFTWHTLHDAKTGICDVNITGGTIGSEGVTGKGNVFGASKGLSNTYQCEKAMVDSTNVNISNGTVYGSVYGGGEIARVEGNTVVTIGVEGETGEGVAPDIRCNVFGAGAGVETHGYSALVRGNTFVFVQGRSKIGRNVYGGGEIASVGKYKVANADTLAKYPELVAHGIKVGMPYALTSEGLGICRVTVKDIAKIGPDSIGHVFGAGKGIVPHYDGTNKRMTFNNNNENVWETFASEEDYMKFVETMALATKTFVDIDGSAFVKGSVYGGSESGFVQNNTQVTIQGSSCQIGTADTGGNVYGGGLGIEGNAVAGRVLGNTTLYIINGTMYGSVYGGGEAGIVKHDTYVHLKGGTVIHDAYGGGLAADVEGNTYVALNETVADDTRGCVVDRIFGCNNVSGTPKGTVTVHVFKTQKAGATRITNPLEGPNTAKVLGDYDVRAVYGGGNLAAYEPTNAFLEYNSTNKALVDSAYTHVIIDGCDRTSIAQVYGGGNAASTPGTFVEINGSFEIGEVFGGGNGKDSIVVSGVLKENPGANIGYKDYSAVEDTYNTKDKRAEDPFKSYIYGSGQVKVVVHGGLIHAVYGGSNTKGNLRQTAMVILSEKDEADDDYCCFNVGEAYGGGKSADMDAETVMTMDCIPGLDIVYGGAENADVVGGATLNITNGRYGQVFGGNNRGGRIGGSIVVNIEETGCRPIIIGELFGGGNRAAYSIYGYTEKKDGNGDLILDVDGKIQWLPLKSTDAGALSSPYDSPHVNVKSFTSIGDIYGGGYGETAVMIGSPVVNINEVVGGKTNHSQANIATEGTITISEELTPGVVTTRELKYPPHTQGAIGSINNVFGGGNEAEVVGDTYVNIGTEEKIQYVTGADTETKITVKGVNILGNVYGGGNKANVTGQTNVTIGKSE